MIVVKRSVMLLFGVLVTVAILFVGVYGYHLIASGFGSSTTPQVASAAKTTAETVLFSAVVITCVVVLALAAILARSLYLTRELDKIAQMSRHQDFSPEASLRKLGPIGDRLNAVYHNANAISESKSRKISALSELNSFLVINQQTPLLVTDLTGKIIHASRSFEEKAGLSRNEVIDADAGVVLGGIAWNEVETELLRLRTPVARKTKIGEITFYPVEDRAGEIAYVVCTLEKPDRVWLPESMRRDRSSQKPRGETSRRHSVLDGIRGVVAGLRSRTGDNGE